jgi:hypothetical protein
MTQTLYAHMNIIKKEKIIKEYILCVSQINESQDRERFGDL